MRRMGMKGIVGVLLWTAALLPLQAAESTGGCAEKACMVKNFSNEALAALLKKEGYGEAEIREGKGVRFKISGSSVMIYNNYGGDLQIRYIVGGGSWTAEQIQQWNRTKRFTRAYLDDEGDAFLELDILSDGGMTEEVVRHNLKVFQTSLGRYKLFLLEQMKKNSPKS